MTKKDFKKFADLIVELYNIQEQNELVSTGLVEDKLTAILQADNERFYFTKWRSYIDKKMNIN